MAVEALADTGAIVASLNRQDRWHDDCVEALSGLRVPLLTSHAVLTELFHFVGERTHDVQAAWAPDPVRPGMPDAHAGAAAKR